MNWKEVMQEHLTIVVDQAISVDILKVITIPGKL